MRLIRRWLPFAGIACIVGGAVFYYVQWTIHAEKVQVYKLVMAGRLTASASGKVGLLPSYLAMQEAQMFLIAAIVVGVSLIALPFWEAFWVNKRDRAV